MELEFSDVKSEVKGAMCPGRLKFAEQNIIFKNSRTGKVEQINSSDVELANWQKFIDNWGVRLFLKNGTLHRFSGFKEGEKEKIAKFFKSSYSLDMLEKELSVKGWNWGTAKFNGAVLSFDIGNNAAFEVPLSYVSQCPTGKNEVTMEFHPNDDAPVSLLEMRFHIPPAELAGDLDPVEAFHKQVMKNASVISVSGDAIAIFREIYCLTPRGRYDIKIFQAFFQLHGKTFDYKIPTSTVLRLFMLPHKDGRQFFFVISLDPPIKQGQTRYHYLVFLFGQDDETSIELPFTEEELKEKYEDKLEKEIQGPTFEVLGKVMKAIVNRKITTPGNFKGASGTPAIGCSYKAAAGYLYPLERGFIFIHKPPLHIRFEEIASVNFARSGGSTRSFDFEVELKSSIVHTFSSIEKEEYGKLYDFITGKKLRVKNLGKMDKPSYGGEDFGDSDQEGAPDAYLARVKREAQERDDDDDGEDSDESTDEDFNPNMVESDVAEEYDSNPTSTDSDEDSAAGSGGGGGGDDDGKGGGEKKQKKKKKEKKKSKEKSVSDKPRKERRKKKEKDGNMPKRPMSAFFLWLNENRDKIKADNPGIAVTDVAKKGSELWKKLSDKSEWDAKAVKAKAEYEQKMKEYISDDSSSDDDADKKKKKSPVKAELKKEEKSDGGASSEASADSESEKEEKKKKPAKKAAPAKEVKEERSDGGASSEASADSESEKEEEKKKPAKKASPPAKEVKEEKKKGGGSADEDDDEEFDEESAGTTPNTSDDSGSD
ncbi:FACT complex subunit Ssrp1-like [Nilaparvata lugens]|uniref:FACT complex subunit Ssrp1-like n=1 Tax=Nilaparvata lugens TaxID=108931 RepID=UPI00193E6ECE|nr:FACT complex subunit Ssrp1-like [Nilaparvata lugens]